jgi:hypothetical protein
MSTLRLDVGDAGQKNADTHAVGIPGGNRVAWFAPCEGGGNRFLSLGRPRARRSAMGLDLTLIVGQRLFAGTE